MSKDLVKLNIIEKMRSFIDEELYNHYKQENNLASLNNCYLDQFERIFKKWEKDDYYLQKCNLANLNKNKFSKEQ